MKRQKIALLLLMALHFFSLSAQKWYNPGIDKKAMTLPKESFIYFDINSKKCVTDAEKHSTLTTQILYRS